MKENNVSCHEVGAGVVENRPGADLKQSRVTLLSLSAAHPVEIQRRTLTEVICSRVCLAGALQQRQIM